MARELLFRLTKKDFEIQTFRSGGKGGQHQNKTNSGVRIIHKKSGAVGESRESRHQHINKKLAFERLVDTPEFKKWHKLKSSYALKGVEDMKKEIEKQVDNMMKPENLKIEYYTPVKKNYVCKEHKERGKIKEKS